MSTFHYPQVTQDKITALLSKLASSGVAIVQTNGQWSIQGHGVFAIASFERTNGVLSVCVMSKPFFVSDSMIDNGIKEALKLRVRRTEMLIDIERRLREIQSELWRDFWSRAAKMLADRGCRRDSRETRKET